MTDFQKDIIKIVLDKGLLAILLIGLTFYLNRIIEKLRAKNIYRQKILDLKLDAYKEIIVALLEYSQSILTFNEELHNIKTALQKKGQIDYKDHIDRLIPLYENYKKLIPIIKKNSLFISSQIMSEILIHMNQWTLFAKTLTTTTVVDIDKLIATTENENFEISIQSAIDKILREIYDERKFS